jgi:hypothetical protein
MHTKWLRTKVLIYCGENKTEKTHDDVFVLFSRMRITVQNL